MSVHCYFYIIEKEEGCTKRKDKTKTQENDYA